MVSERACWYFWSLYNLKSASNSFESSMFVVSNVLRTDRQNDYHTLPPMLPGEGNNWSTLIHLYTSYIIIVYYNLLYKYIIYILRQAHAHTE